MNVLHRLKTVALFLLIGSMIFGIACNTNSGNKENEKDIVLEMTYPWFERDYMLIAAAGLIVTGTVTSVEQEIVTDNSGTYPVQVCSVDVTDVYKGDCSGSLTFSQPGGMLNGKTYVCERNVDIAVGTEYLLILEGSSTGYLTLVNPGLSVYNAETGETYSGNIFTMQQILKATEKNQWESEKVARNYHRRLI